jgi:hypothetical protein
MSDVVAPLLSGSRVSPPALIRLAAALWFVIALAGNWAFALYIAAHYGRAAFAGNWQAWNERLINGFVAGDVFGNALLFLHMALALVLTFAGPLQFVPAVRKRAPTLHRWIGRAYLASAFVVSAGALYMIYTRDDLGLFGSTAVQVNAVLILVFSALTLRYALMRDFARHHRWALRTFIVVSGVWFLRVGYGLLAMIFQGPIPGANNSLTGPADVALGWASYLLPLAVLELYFLARERGGVLTKSAMATLLLACSVATAIGVVGAAMIFWLPTLNLI